ncbi:hypothetical protein PspLS_02463 [Pyricularia sp. CBS 133598]|nr:hypothetical protein PspLS_02463 [Pyricularia sp. CBS 133598]
MRFQYILFILFTHGSIASNNAAPNNNIAAPNNQLGGHESNADESHCYYEDELGGHGSDNHDGISHPGIQVAGDDRGEYDLKDPRTRQFLFLACWHAWFCDLDLICQGGMPDSAIELLADKICEPWLHGLPEDTASAPKSCPSSPRSLAGPHQGAHEGTH